MSLYRARGPPYPPVITPDGPRGGLPREMRLTLSTFLQLIPKGGLHHDLHFITSPRMTVTNVGVPST